MALIGTIRKNSWLMIVVIGFALAAFIIMDMTSASQRGGGGGDTFSMGTINGKAVDWNDFQNAEQLVYGNSQDLYGRRSALWNYFVEEAIVSKQAESLGLNVSSDELQDLEFGANPSPVIAARFRNPQTGQLDITQLNQIKQQIDDGSISPDLARYWKHQRKEIKKNRLQGKINSMVSKALYTPNWMVEQTHSAKNQKIKMDYIKIPFADIDDSDISLTDADFSSYLTSNKGKFYQDEETRRVDYVVFNVYPSSADSAAIRGEMADLAERFRTTDNDTTFTSINNGTMSSQWIDANGVSESVRNEVMSLPIGTVYGPYLDGNFYKTVKILDRKSVPDSATTRHILINASDPTSFAAAFEKVDSIKGAIQGGASFADMAEQFSQDPGSAQEGGKYENIPPNQFVPEYGDVASFGKIGQLYSVRTQYGVHLIEPLSRTREATDRARLAYLSEPIEPSDRTQSEAFDQANTFLSENRSLENLNTAASNSGNLATASSPSIKSNDYILGNLGSGTNAREIIRWAFESNTDIGDVSPTVYDFQPQGAYYNDKYVIVGLKSIQAAGMPSVANIKDEIEAQVRNQKKGELIKSKISGTNLNSLASQFDVTVDEATDITFDTKFKQGLGDEPKVIATAFNTAVNGVSAPITGNSGVFVVKVKEKPAAGAPTNIPQLRRDASANVQNQVSSLLMQAMRKEADISDNRSQFY